MATLIAPKYFSPVEDAENIKKACLGFSSLFLFFLTEVFVLAQQKFSEIESSTFGMVVSALSTDPLTMYKQYL